MKLSFEDIEPYYQTGRLKRTRSGEDFSTNQEGGINIDVTSWNSDSDVIQDNRTYNDQRTINININLPENIDSENLANALKQIKQVVEEKPKNIEEFETPQKKRKWKFG
jgi:hypothetical protein